MDTGKNNNKYSDKNTDGDDHCKYLINNYIFFIDKLFKHSKIDISSILSNDKKDANLLAYDNEKKVEQLQSKGQSLKDKIDREPSGYTARDFDKLTHLTNLRDGEQFLKNNSLYIFAQEIFVCLHDSSRKYFVSLMKQLCGYSPKRIQHREYIILKILNVLTFSVSTYTTAYGVNHLLQKNNLAILSAFNGDEGEIPRIITSFLIGFLLSSIIFHLKTSLFKGILSTGKIFEGIKQIYLRRPWKILFATLILSLSLKTNYDGGIALISKSEYINEQFQVISRQAFAAYD
ncbi:MAG: hypothetical protein HQK53_06750, partial [Oligoflexia bacterium]|nr:hypothetical protein [Oligoflexia bacterium]